MLRKRSRWPSFAALVIALIGVAVGIVGWSRPTPQNSPPPTPPAPTFTEKEVTDAKADVCDAYKTVAEAVRLNTHRPKSEDEIGSLAAVANGRLALYAGGDYLLDRLVAEPATPADLATAVQSLARTLKKFGIIALADAPDSVQDPLRRDLDSDVGTIDRLCK
jgi:hypothetical protein